MTRALHQGVATTKREAKQRAAQLMLKQLRPEARSWGELLDLEEADTAAVRHRDHLSTITLALGLGGGGGLHGPLRN